MISTCAVQLVNTSSFEVAARLLVCKSVDIPTICPVWATPAAMNANQAVHLQAESNSDCTRAAYTEASAFARTPYTRAINDLAAVLFVP